MCDWCTGICEEGGVTASGESTENFEFEGALSRFIGSASSSERALAQLRKDFRTKSYWLYRTDDVTGVSGRGLVANVAVFPNGSAVTAWRVPGKPNSVTIWNSLDDLLEIHGHDGKTILIPEE
jgi:hypothetical protein